ncbi:FAD-binding protein [Acidiferrimicrobium sp. IK]|uniref:FAD-dependent oxidoreductase n=1 Tax=Acidiferrimicrobium sp. IK TaxID=2871700 RepID=UPI0021CB0D6A|nr:FAD-binding protein [Acidiferrimicrobium sp. IK]MCU4186757.1 FAD-binding protein [Acidiferrimicrobium sp. IK]
MSPDLVVAGAGGGVAGALRAAELGLRVLVVESSPQFRQGNNTSMSTAMLPGAGTRWQADAGVDDSPQTFVDDIMAKTEGQADPELATALAEVSGRLVTWLADHAGAPIELATDFSYPGHSRYRCHTIPHRRGALLLGVLLDGLDRSASVDLLTPARLVDVVTTDGRVTAALVSYPDGTTEEIECGAVLLATNGFGANREMVSTHIPEMARATYHGSAESRGDALRIGTGLGADTAFLDAYQGHGALSTPYATLTGWATVMHGGLLVNADGLRFGDETTGYSEFGHQVVAQPGGTAVLVFDQRIHDACLVFDDFRATVDAGALRWADSPAGLGEAFGIDPAAFSETIEESRALARSGGVDRFGRSFWEQPLGLPLAGVRVTGALFHTQGGLRVDGQARVLRADGTAIGGLYASGGAAMGISGHGAAGYLAGNGLLPALGLAFLAAEDVARRRGA